LALGGLYREIYDLQLRDQERLLEQVEVMPVSALTSAAQINSNGVEGE